MPTAPFGNDPAKIDRYKTFWSLGETPRPLVGFTLAGWFPLVEFAACRPWQSISHLAPGMIDPEACVDDHIRLLSEGEAMDDDFIRGACPLLVTVPWIAGALGAPLRVLPENVLGEERRIPWEEALAIRLDEGHPWFRKYVEFAAALVRASYGRFPVSHTPELGPTDIFALLRGHSDSIIDLTDEPERSSRLLDLAGEFFRDFTEALWRRLPLWHGGWFDAQYSLWAPGPIIRMQEDATAVYSPALYRRFVQPVDRMLATRFASSFMHLHSTSMFILDAILEIEAIRCFQVNNDVCGPPIPEMIPFFRRIQQARRPLLIRGSFSPDELRLLTDSLDPRGLMLNIMVGSFRETEPLRPIVGL